MNAVGLLLAEVDEHRLPAAATVFLRIADGHGVELISRSRAVALLEQVTANPLLDVTGDLTCGFAWPVPGAHPRRSYAVIPLAAPVWPNTPHPTAVTVELWWPPEQDGRRHVRSFLVWADDPFNAYLIACCLWSTRSTGAGAGAAFLYGPDRQTVYRISAGAWTCSGLPAETIARAVATVTDRFSVDQLPDTPRTSAAQQTRIDGVLTYTGTREEIGNGGRTEFRGRPHYRVVEAVDSSKTGLS